MTQNRLFRLIDKLIYDYDILKDGDKILVGASGGKDSTVLVEYFANRTRRPDCNFTFTALNIQTEIGGKIPEKIEKLFSEWNVDFKVVKINVQERLKNGRKMNCYWCSTQRRTELNNYAIEHGYNKIALGHHLDDVLETLFMNAMYKAELSTMIPELKYDKYPVSIIRPLYYALEQDIILHAKEKGFYGYTCTCNFQDNSARKDVRKKIAELTENNPILKRHLFDSLKNINTRYLP